ncbi:MAG: TetR/AcrR family transcriptional regulator [Treponema sp.]|nr:TetR/AcrR family transcriptional regulator [Treponema sp.]
MRVVKDAEERKNEILDVAERLFSAKGFESTSMNDIQNEIGIARGTLYYHFKSKEEILNAIIERVTARIMENAEAVARDKSLPVVERLVKTILSMRIRGNEMDFLMEHIHKPQNALMHQKIQEKTVEAVNPIITDIVKDGIEQKIFQTEYPEQAVEMATLYSNSTFHEVGGLEDAGQLKKVMGFIYNLERLLGTERGSLEKALMPLFEDDRT